MQNKINKKFIAISLALVLCLVLFACLAWAQGGASPYSGQELRKIKALSPDQISGLLQGQGLGMAKPAELNHYPGPRHVLDLAAKLELTKDQIKRTEDIYADMRKSAVRLGREIVKKERALDQAFVRANISGESLRREIMELGRLWAELRLVHLKAHLAQKKILSAEQVARYDRLRGYGSGAPSHHQHGSGGHH